MPRIFSHVEYADMVFVYGFCNGNARAAVIEYNRRFPTRTIPDHKVFIRTFNNLRENGSFPSTHINSERQDEQNLDEVENIIQAVERSPGTSSRRISMQLNTPHTRVWRTLRKMVCIHFM
jgi:hypothetical protein